jgi:hypothetical protein
VDEISILGGDSPVASSTVEPFALALSLAGDRRRGVVCPGQAGHDYRAIETSGFARRVFRTASGPVVVPADAPPRR